MMIGAQLPAPLDTHCRRKNGVPAIPGVHLVHGLHQRAALWRRGREQRRGRVLRPAQVIEQHAGLDVGAAAAPMPRRIDAAQRRRDELAAIGRHWHQARRALPVMVRPVAVRAGVEESGELARDQAMRSKLFPGARRVGGNRFTQLIERRDRPAEGARDGHTLRCGAVSSSAMQDRPASSITVRSSVTVPSARACFGDRSRRPAAVVMPRPASLPAVA